MIAIDPELLAGIFLNWPALVHNISEKKSGIKKVSHSTPHTHVCAATGWEKEKHTQTSYMLAQKTHMCSGMDKHQGLIDWYKSDKECIFWQKWVTITLLLPSDKKELQKEPKECGFEAYIT